ncbi:hypothetical protein LX32DRAFT_394225 [Colletotrichum zoysiae]|uniref:Uncharacterized protein n=1 Tax=Colletotrichum zoysiae TaxID=1216348 RepID=A0AAD9HGT1_9PEZI|nr:hypothetical protein LX32DRAFT_394225 [Colletotrichum zoysiae]
MDGMAKQPKPPHAYSGFSGPREPRLLQLQTETVIDSAQLARCGLLGALETLGRDLDGVGARCEPFCPLPRQKSPTRRKNFQGLGSHACTSASCQSSSEVACFLLFSFLLPKGSGSGGLEGVLTDILIVDRARLSFPPVSPRTWHVVRVRWLLSSRHA